MIEFLFKSLQGSAVEIISLLVAYIALPYLRPLITSVRRSIERWRRGLPIFEPRETTTSPQVVRSYNAELLEIPVFSSKCAAAVEKSQKWFGFFMIGWMILPGMIFAIIGGIVSSEGAGSGFFVGFLFSIFGGALFLNSFQSYVYFSNGFLRPPIGPDSNSRGSLVTWRDGEVLYIGQPSVGLLKIRHAGDISFIATKSRLYFGVRISNTPQGEDFYLIKIPTVYKRYFSEGIAEHISNQLNRFVGPDAACDEMKHASLDEA